MLYIVTAVHNRYNITKKFVKQICEQTYKDITLVLVDDGSTDGTDKMVKKLMPNAIVIYGNGNLWWGGALHKAYLWLEKHIKSEDYVWIANDDTTFDVDYCKKAIDILNEMGHIQLTGYGISKQTGERVDGATKFIFPEVFVQHIYEAKAYGNCASTRSLFLHADDYKKVGGFHPILLPHYGSDYEWTIRGCRKYGLEVYCTKDLQYKVNEETTGYHNLKMQSIKKIFSKKSMSNPIYKYTFIFLASPITKLPMSIWTQTLRFIKKSKNNYWRYENGQFRG